jgi:hypothetical protein
MTTTTADDANMKMVAYIQNLERYCNEIAQNKLLWTPEVLIFFSIAVEDLHTFEMEREVYQRKRQTEIMGSGADKNRRMSYSNFEDFNRVSYNPNLPQVR